MGVAKESSVIFEAVRAACAQTRQMLPSTQFTACQRATRMLPEMTYKAAGRRAQITVRVTFPSPRLPSLTPQFLGDPLSLGPGWRHPRRNPPAFAMDATH